MALKGALWVVGMVALAFVIAPYLGVDLIGWAVGAVSGLVTGLIEWIGGGVTDTILPPW